jgi:hypothetical protein
MAAPRKGALLARFINNQFKLQLGHFVRCLMLGLRTNLGEIAGSHLILECVSSSFLNGFQNVVLFSEDDDGPEPAFIERQTLGEVFRETVGLVSATMDCPPVEYEHNCEAEIEQLNSLLRKFSRRITFLLLSFAVIKNWNRSSDMFRETLRQVDTYRKPIRTSWPENKAEHKV